MTCILVIDDEVPLLEEVSENLRFEGYVVLSASNGQQGLDLAVGEVPDLIICDVLMPKLDGYGVLLGVRAEPKLVNVPFIFLTARTEKNDIRRGMALGADDYLTKPFTLSELLESIKARLEKKQILERDYEQKLEDLSQALMQAEERFKIKSKFISMFSHEFRTPLTVIISSINLIRDYSDKLTLEEHQTYLKHAESAALRLSQALDDILLIGQLETSRFNFRPELIDISDYAESIISEMRLTMGAKHKVVFASNFHGLLLADLKLIRQIFSNLISNAIKYSSFGSKVLIEIVAEGDNCVIKVKDEGIGIPSEDHPSLFEPFHRANNVGEITGTGLGLLITKQAVEKHKGVITFESTTGIGTTFYISIPCNTTNN